MKTQKKTAPKNRRLKLRPNKPKMVNFTKNQKGAIGSFDASRRFSKKHVIIFVILFGLMGAYFIFSSFAATPLTEKAKGKTSTASSTESANYVAAKGNDGSNTTRWASLGSNDQWWQVDLGTSTPVSQVDINWEVAYASHYYIQGSTDGSNFVNLADVTNTKSGIKSTTFPEKSVRYVRIFGLTRGTPWGFSIWETQVYGSSSSTPVPTPTPAPTPTPTPTPAPAPASTSTMPVGNLVGWKQIFAEDFNTAAPLGSFLTTYKNFGAYPYPWTDTSHNVRSANPGYYYPEKTLSVSNSAMDAWLHYDSALGKYLVAAPKPILPTMTYGKFSMRLRADKIPGYKIAPLMWPDSEKWPADGELDFPEGNLNGSAFSAFSHYANPNGGQDYYNTGVDPTTWHIYDVAWSPGKVQYSVDGKAIGTSTTNVPVNPMHWVLQMETQISSVSPPTTSQGHVQIDWVTAYSYAP